LGISHFALGRKQQSLFYKETKCDEIKIPMIGKHPYNEDLIARCEVGFVDCFNTEDKL
jgi:hypothetical protein